MRKKGERTFTANRRSKSSTVVSSIFADFAAVARSYGQDIAAGGATIATGCEVRGIEVGARSLRITHAQGTTEARNAVFCAGLDVAREHARRLGQHGAGDEPTRLAQRLEMIFGAP